MALIDSYTKLLLHCDGSNGSTTFSDSENTPKTVNVDATVQISTATYRFGGQSASFDGDSGRLYVNNSSDWNFGTGDFTIDFWINIASGKNAFFSYFNIDKSGSHSAGNYCVEFSGSSGLVNYLNISDGTSMLVNIPTLSSLDDDSWHHHACVRYGSNFMYFIDGLLQGSTTAANAVNWDSSMIVNIGSRTPLPTQTYGFFTTCYIDEARITKGIARWYSSFLPPTRFYGAKRQKITVF